MSDKTLIVLNPHAGGGRAGRLWTEIEPLLWEELGELVVAVTQAPEDVAAHLDKARDAGLTRVVSIGGDGTNHTLVNAIQQLAEANPDAPKMTFAHLPIGSGQDFARVAKIPYNPRDAVKWIAHGTPQPIDLGHVQYNGDESRHFLNIASVGVSGETDRRMMNPRRKRLPGAFKLTAMESFFFYKPRHTKIWLDGELWYDDKSWIVVVANGAYFGHGMAIAPHAQINDGLFEVLVVENVPRWRVMKAFNSVYSGKHLLRDDVRHTRAQSVTVESRDGKLDIDLDGEYAKGEQLQFTLKAGALQMLVGS